MKTKLSIALTLVLCAVLFFAFGTGALAANDLTLTGKVTAHSTCYNYGEEVHTVVVETEVALNPETVSVEDFEAYFMAKNFCGNIARNNRTIDSIEIDGKTMTLNLKVTGNGSNAPLDNFNVVLVGEVADTAGNTYNASTLEFAGQVNEELDKFLDLRTEDVQYRLYVPEGAEDTATPLYIWLHGAGEFGTDNRSQVSCSNLVNWTTPAVQNIFGGKLYVMAIQSPNSPHNPAELMDAVLEVCENYNIDMSRIYVAGCSMGGMGTNQFIAAYPEFFAAAVPNCAASVIGADDAAKLVDLPIIFVHAANDTTVRLSNSIQSYNNLVAAGSKNVWCNFYTKNPVNEITGSDTQGHWSWIWIHDNFTTTEEEFIKGEGVYTNNGVEYPYVSTPLSEIGAGYANIASWLAAQKNDKLVGGTTIYSSIYNYGEEVHTVTIQTAKLNPETVEASDFAVSYNGRARTVESVEVNGNTVTLNLVVTGSGNNNPITNYTVELVGEVADVNGKAYSASAFFFVEQINPQVDQFLEYATDNVQYRLYVPENTDDAQPLYIWLHGAGEFGTNNRSQLVCSNLVNWTTPKIQNIFGGDLYVMAIQSPKSPHNPANIMEAIQEVCDNYNIDTSRVYLAGCSMGGRGVNDVITAYPSFFAAAIPNCAASVISPEAAAKLVDLPIILVHAANDTTVRLSNSIQSYDNLVAAGSENVWACFYTKNPVNEITGRDTQGHWSWIWIHDNFTTTEDEFIKGEGVYTRNGVDYPYVSTSLADIGDGYTSIAAWLADQQNTTISADYTLYTTNYVYGEELDSVELVFQTAIDAETVTAEDFEVYTQSGTRKNAFNITSVEVDGKTVTIEVAHKGSGVNINATTTYKIAMAGSISDKNGNEYTNANLTCLGQVNPHIDQFQEGETEHMKYRIYVPETDKKAPLLIWLHGGGEFGTENRAQLSCSTATVYAEPEIQKLFGGALYVLAPQSPAPKPHITTNIKEVIDAVLANEDYNIDLSRIYIMGCSQGGKTTNEMVSEYPDIFAAAISNCPYQSYITEEAAANLVDLPMLYLHALNDTTAMPYESITSYDNLRAAGNDSVWCLFYSRNPDNPVTGKAMMGHWSWSWLHSNCTTTEEYFVKGEGVYTRNGVDYPYVSTPLSEIGDGYENIMSWLADQQKGMELSGDLTIHSTCYNYGEEVHTVTIEVPVAINAETVSPEDFEVSYMAKNFCGNIQRSTRAVESVEIDGTTITLNLKMTGNNLNAPLDNYNVALVGDIYDVEGVKYSKTSFTFVGQANEELDQFLDLRTEDVQYRLYVPEGAEDEATPLYIWLHGAGEFGTDNRSQVSCSNLVDWIKPEVQDIFGGKLYVMAIQSPSSPHDPAELMDAVLEVCGNYNIDMSRIYVAGCSMGGMGTNQFITAYPTFFAAAIPNCAASVISPEAAATLTNLPIIFVHAENDTTVRLSNSILSYDNLKAAGSDNVWCCFYSKNPVNEITGRDTMGHFSWIWIHDNFTTTEEEFIKGEGVYTNNGVEYPYVSTPLSEIGDGYANIASWLAAQKNPGTIDIETVVINGDETAVNVYYNGVEDIQGITMQIDTELAIKRIETKYVNLSYGNSVVIISGDKDGAPMDKSAPICTIIFDTSDAAYGMNAISGSVKEFVDGSDKLTKKNPVVVAGAVVNVLPGDVDFDGSVTTVDLVAIARYIIGTNDLSDLQVTIADYDGDGAITTADLVKLARAMVAE